jgi:hypothetical protein
VKPKYSEQHSVIVQMSFIYFPVVPNLEHRPPFGISVITHTIRHPVELLWMSDQPVAETSTYTEETRDKHPCRERELSEFIVLLILREFNSAAIVP